MIQIDDSARTKRIYRVTLVGTICNLLLLVVKFVAGFVGHSSAMIADAVHSLSDLLTDVVVFAFVKLSARPQDLDHNYGHGKYETMATAIVGLMLVGVGVMLLYSGGEKVWQAMHGEVLEAPGWIAFIVAIISLVVKEGLFHYTMREGRRLESKVVEANAWHHRSDSYSSIATALGIGGAILFGAKWRILDPIAAMLVSVLIIKVAFDLMIPAMSELLEKSLPKNEEQMILDIVRREKGVSDPHNLRTRRVGVARSIEMHMRVDPDMTVSESHQITRRIEKNIRDTFGPHTYINIHVEPRK